MEMDKSEFGIKTIDLKSVITDLLSIYNNGIDRIYLFGSRGYQTNSLRSDIDIILVCDSYVDITSLKIFLESHRYLDFFIGNGASSSVHSLVNDSVISLRPPFEDLFVQLDAKELWNDVDGFVQKNEIFFLQDIKTNVKWHPSSFASIDPIINIKKFLKNYSSSISDRQKVFLSSACECYEEQIWLGFISLIGAYLETLLLDLIKTYESRVFVLFNSCLNDYQSQISNFSTFISIKTRMERFIHFISNHDPNFSKRYLKDKGHDTFLETTFDIARRYRNEVDHCLEHNFDDDDCNQLVLLFAKNIQIVVEAINTLNSTPGL